MEKKKITFASLLTRLNDPYRSLIPGNYFDGEKFITNKDEKRGGNVLDPSDSGTSGAVVENISNAVDISHHHGIPAVDISHHHSSNLNEDYELGKYHQDARDIDLTPNGYIGFIKRSESEYGDSHEDLETEHSQNPELKSHHHEAIANYISGGLEAGDETGSRRVNENLINHHVHGHPLIRVHKFESQDGEDYHRELNIDHLDEALSKNKLKKKLVTYSGIGFNPKNYIRGVSSLHLPAYTSSSVDKVVALGYAKNVEGDGVRHVIEIHHPKGSDGFYVGNNEDYSPFYQKEHIMPRGVTLKVEKEPTIYHDNYGGQLHVWKATRVLKKSPLTESTEYSYIHYSHQPRTHLDPTKHGTGISDAADKRLVRDGLDRSELKNRVYFYLKKGDQLPPKEAGIGNVAHEIFPSSLKMLDFEKIDNDEKERYNSIKSGIIQKTGVSDASAHELDVKQMGYDGYVNNNYGFAVAIRNEPIPVDKLHS